jgi:hypothetical protein
VNLGDVAKLYAHVRSTASLSETALRYADLNGDGEINIGDTALLYHTVRTTLISDR